MGAPEKIVAIVEDDAGLSRGIERLLQAHGFATETYSSAEEFLQANSSTASCLIIDIHLGGMTGIELRRQLGDTSQRVIFITASDRELDRKEALAAGCVAYLCKPFSAVSLLTAISGAADSTQARC
jgi:DNA-binding response OmpR family regulator